MYEDNTPEHEYIMIDWAKSPAPWSPIKKVILTEYEAQTKNRALALNQTSLRYIKEDKDAPYKTTQSG